MAKAMTSNSESNLKSLIDCMYFISGHCRLNEQCRYRHCREAANQTNNCHKWPQICRNITCPYRHPAIQTKPAAKKKLSVSELLPNYATQPQAPRGQGLISLFWDIENVPIPKGQKPFDIVQRIRQKLVVETGLQEAAFSCYCNSTMISQDNQLSLHHASVRIVHIPDRKPNAVDHQIMLDLDRFERIHRTPATIVLISGDIDFVGKLSDLRHQAGYHVIVIHNKPAKEELKATVNEHYPWELFTQPLMNGANGFGVPGSERNMQALQPLMNGANGFDVPGSERAMRTAAPNRMRHQSSDRNLRRRDPSPYRPFPPHQQQPILNNREVKKEQPRMVYICPKCPSEFESIQAVRQHQNAKKHLFDCPVCNESLFTQADQNQHQKDKNHFLLEFKCDQCTRRFAKMDSLNQHQQATGHTPSSNLNELTPQQTPSSSVVTENHSIDDDSIIIILQGIEAIKEYYAKRLSRNY